MDKTDIYCVFSFYEKKLTSVAHSLGHQIAYNIFFRLILLQ